MKSSVKSAVTSASEQVTGQQRSRLSLVQLGYLFKRLDSDDSNELQQDEFFQISSRLHVDVKKEELSVIFKIADKNGNFINTA